MDTQKYACVAVVITEYPWTKSQKDAESRDLWEVTCWYVYTSIQVKNNPGGGGGELRGGGGDAGRKFWIKPLKETDLGVAQAFFHP